MHGAQNGVIILRRLAKGIDKTRAEHEVGLFQRHEARRLAAQGQNLFEKGGFLGRTNAEQVLARALEEQGDGDVAGGDDRVIGGARDQKPVELRRDDPAGIGRIGDEHDLAALRARNRLSASAACWNAVTPLWMTPQTSHKTTS